MKWLQGHGLVIARRKYPRRGKSLWTALFFAWLAAFCSSLPTIGAPLPACLPPVVGGAKVIRIRDNGVLILDGRRTVKLEGLLWPAGARGGTPDPAVAQSIAALQRLIAAHRLVLHSREPKLDRFDRLRVHALLADGEWLQREIVRRGLARVSVAPDRPECARELYAAEAEARAAGLGLWANSTYRVRTPESLRWQDLGTFQIVEGQVLSAKVTGGRGYLDFGRNWRTDFTATIAPEDMKRFISANIDPESFAGKRVRVRGWIDRLHGFEIEASSPAQIEVLK
jgi:endonuclease YncB( thermonuclease family)